MRQILPAILFVVGLALAVLPASTAWGYVEGHYTMGKIVAESTHIVLMELTKVNKEKNLLVFKKVEDIKGKHAATEIKHNIGQRGFHAREWQNIAAWAEVGKRAVFFHNGSASETCIGDYWYQCYPEGEWWAMSHAEPFLLRAYCGDAGKLASGVVSILKGEEVVLPCMMDGNKDLLHTRKAKIHRLKASLTRVDYNAKRDFVALGGDGDEITEYKNTVLIGEGAADWKFLPAVQAAAAGDRWRALDFDDASWRTGKAPIGYGEAELEKRSGTKIAEQGQPFVFRRAIDIPAETLAAKGVTFRLCLASDDGAQVFVNGVSVDQDLETDHEFSYWNRDLELPAKAFQPGRNIIAVHVKNKAGSSDLYLDLELSSQIPVKAK